MATDIGIRATLNLPYEQAVQKTTDALKAEGFGVLSQIDMRATLKQKLDVDFRRYVILGACNPPLAHRALSANLADIVEAILRDQSTVLSVSSLIQDYCGINDVCLSLPVALNRGGVEWVLPMDLNLQETEAMCQSARVLKTTIAQLKLE